MQKALKIKEERDRKDNEHLSYMAKLDAMLEIEKQRMKDAQISREREVAIRQREQDIERARALADGKYHPSPQPQPQSVDDRAGDHNVKLTQTNSNHPYGEKPVLVPEVAEPKIRGSRPRRESPAKEEWESLKKMENASNDAIDSVIDMVGLEEVKLQILKIKAKIDASIRQNSNMKEDRLNVAFLGNPGTGIQ